MTFTVNFSRPSGLHPYGGNTLFTAQYKAGKTTTVNNLVRSLADYKPFLGFETRKLDGRIALWNYEMLPAQELAWLRALEIEHPERVTLLHLRGKRMPLDMDACRQWTIDWLRSLEIEFWLLDPIARAATGVDIERDNIATNVWLENLDEIKRLGGVVDCLLTAHTPRADNGRTAGAHRLDDWPDALWSLTRNDHGQRFFSARGRGVDVAEFPLDFDPTTGRLSASADTRANVEAEAYARDFAELVANNPGANTTTLETRWKRDKNKFGLAKGAAIENGLIHVHKRGNPTLHYPGPASDGCHE